MAQAMAAHGIQLVDGGIIGGPAWTPGATWLYLSGPRAAEVAECFSAGPPLAPPATLALDAHLPWQAVPGSARGAGVETRALGDEVGKASALKMCFAAYTKGSTALLSAVMAAAERLNVREDLYRQWGLGDAQSAERNEQSVRRVTAKAWRFAGEMDEIAATFQDAGLPGGFHQAAAEVYHRMAQFKDSPAVPEITEVLEALLNPDINRDEEDKGDN
jgi:3-hydroxyisobutyrate dehydrogenase-like beta-hydroxyacid dehydrogenase